MKTLILYISQCGHTKRYVDTLSVRIMPDKVLKYSHVSLKTLKEYDTIIYMAPIKNNVIVKLDKFIKHYPKLKDKNIFICAVGLSCRNMDDYTKHLLITTNDLDDKHVRLYLLPGGIDLKLMSPIKRFIFKKGLELASKKNDTPGLGAGIENIIRNGVDFVDLNCLDRIVFVYNKIKDN